MPDNASRILKNIPWGDVLDLADALLDDGNTKSETTTAIASFLDEALDFNTLLPGVGVALELIDGPVFKAAIGVVMAMASDPERRDERRERRAERKAARKAKRDRKRASRQN